MSIGAAIATGIGSSAISGGLGFLGASSANAKNLKMQKRQHKFQERMADVAYHRARRQARQERKMGRREARKARTHASREAKRARSWMKTMSNTEMRRRVKDLRKAGLNPILAAGGPGATSQSASPPSSAVAARGAGSSGGGAPSGGMARAINELEHLGPTAAAAMRLTSDLAKLNQESELIKARTEREKVETEIRNINKSSARDIARIDKERANQAEDFGPSFLGQSMHSLRQMFGWIVEGVVDMFQKHNYGTSPVIDIFPGPAIHQPKGLLPDEMEGFPQ